MKRKRGIFQKEISNLMYGFGDVPNPLPESVECLEELLDWFVLDLCERAQKRAATAKLKTSDFLLALEGDGKKLARAHELLTLDKVLKQARSTFGDAVTEFE
jgi:transcription initiation factor TFIID subunit 13